MPNNDDLRKGLTTNFPMYSEDVEAALRRGNEVYGYDIPPGTVRPSIESASVMEKRMRQEMSVVRDIYRSHQQDIFGADIKDLKQYLRGVIEIVSSYKQEGGIPAPGSYGAAMLSLRGTATSHLSALEMMEASANPLNRGYNQEELWRIRSQARMARSALQMGEELTPEQRKMFEEKIQELSVDIKRIHHQVGTGAGMSDAELHRFSTESRSKGNLLKELQNIVNASNKDQKRGLDKTMGFLSALASTMALSTIASHRFIQDPFTYGFRPAMNVMGQQGAVGGALGSAFTQEKQYDVGLNQTFMMAGAGGAIAGLNTMRTATTAAGRGAGLATMAIGSVVSALSAAGVFNNVLQSLHITTSKDKIIQQSIAQTVANPQTLLQNFQGSVAGLIQAGAGSQFGYYYGDQAAAHRMLPTGQIGTGNAVLDQFIMGQGRNMRGLGYTAAQMGQLMSQVSLNTVSANRQQLLGNTAFVGELARGYGINEGAATGMLQTAQMMGSQNAQRSVQMAAGATAQNGQISNFAMSVLVPSLLKVTESLQLKNVARTNQNLEKEVTNLYHTMSESGTNLGNLMKTNPQAFATVANQIYSGVQSQLSNPATLAYSMSLGNSFKSIFKGSPQVTQSILQSGIGALTQNGMLPKGWQNMNPADLVGENPLIYGALQPMMQQTGFQGVPGAQILLNLMQMVGKNKFIGDNGQMSAEAKAAVDKGQSQVQTRAEQIVQSQLGKLNTGISAQVDAMTNASQVVMKQMETIQNMLLKYASGHQIIDDAKAGIQRMVTQMAQVLNQPNPYKQGSATEAAAIPVPQRKQNAQAVLDTWLSNNNITLPSGALTSLRRRVNALTTGPNAITITPQYLNAHFGPNATSIPGHAIGGFTGSGGRMDIAGIVHGGEYVISDNNTRNNRQLLDRIQSGENISQTSSVGESSITDTGGTVYLTMAFNGMSVKDITKIAHQTTENYVVKNRLMY